MKILWLKTELLHPVDKGGKIRTYQMLKQLKKDHRITYLTLDNGESETDALDQAAEYADEVIAVPHRTSRKFTLPFYAELARNLGSSLPYALQKYVSAEMAQKIRSLARPGNFDVVVCDFLTPAVNLPPTLEIASLLFQHNVEAMIWRRHFEVARGVAKKAFMKMQWRRMFEYERECLSRFDWVVGVSREDADMMRADYGIENVGDVPTGVDTDYFTPQKERGAENFNLVFTGSMDWLPNEDAIVWFTGEIFPRIREKIPQATLTVVGRDPFPSLIELSKKDNSIKVTGRVPDVRPFMEEAGVYVVPIRIGGGTRLKIYEALAMELPVVSTAVGAEGLPLENGREILLRDTPGEFAEACVALMRDRDLARRTGLAAARTVREKFGWDKVAEDFARHCEKAIAARGSQNKRKESERSVSRQANG
ncbi:MAG TPA: glycosyltransferase [Pyrinomonadaceae bacterium]